MPGDPDGVTSGNGVAERLIDRFGLKKSPAFSTGLSLVGPPSVMRLASRPLRPASQGKRAPDAPLLPLVTHLSQCRDRPYGGSKSPRPSHLRWCISYGGAAMQPGEPAS